MDDREPLSISCSNSYDLRVPGEYERPGFARLVDRKESWKRIPGASDGFALKPQVNPTDMPTEGEYSATFESLLELTWKDFISSCGRGLLYNYIVNRKKTAANLLLIYCLPPAASSVTALAFLVWHVCQWARFEFSVIYHAAWVLAMISVDDGEFWKDVVVLVQVMGNCNHYRSLNNNGITNFWAVGFWPPTRLENKPYITHRRDLNLLYELTRDTLVSTGSLRSSGSTNCRTASEEQIPFWSALPKGSPENLIIIIYSQNVFCFESGTIEHHASHFR